MCISDWSSDVCSSDLDPEMRARCLELLGESARASARKLKFFRLAFGAAGGFGETVDTREARTAIEGLFGAAKRLAVGRSEERRVGKECGSTLRFRWAPDHLNNKIGTYISKLSR